MRDPWACALWSLGKIGDDGFVLASETCALDIIGAEFIREIDPGEMVVISKGEIESSRPSAPPRGGSASLNMSISRAPIRSSAAARSMRPAARSGSNWRARPRSRPIWSVRSPTAARRPPSVSRMKAASPLAWASSRNQLYGPDLHRTDRTDPQYGRPVETERERALVAGKRVVLVDEFGARHHRARSGHDPGRGRRRGAFPHRLAADRLALCFMASTPDRDASCWRRRCPEEEMREWIGVDSLAFVSLDGLYRAVGRPRPQQILPAILRRLFLGRISGAPSTRSTAFPVRNRISNPPVTGHAPSDKWPTTLQRLE